MDATATRVAGPFTNPDLGFVLDTASVALLDTVGAELSDTESEIALLVGEASTVVLVAVGEAATVVLVPGPYLNTDEGSAATLVGSAASIERVS